MSELNIPEHWAESTLGQLSEKISYGATASSSSKGKFKFLRITDLTENGVSWNSVPFCNIDIGHRYLLSDGDIVIARTGGTVGKSYRIMAPPSNAIYASYLIKVKPIPPFEKNEFLSIFFKSNLYWGEIQDKAQGAAQPNVNATKLGEIKVPVPPLGEQERIIQKIESCFQKIDEAEKALNEAEILLAKYRDSLLAKAFRGELIPQDLKDEPASELLEKIRVERAKNSNGKKVQEFAPISDDETPFDLPVGWEWVRLKDVLLKITDGTHHSPENLNKGDYKYISAKNIKDWGIDLTKISYVSKEVHKEIYSRCDPRKGDVFLIKDGATTGISCINSLDEQFSMLSSVALLRTHSIALNNEYLLYYLKSPLFQELVSDGMAGAAIKRITLDKINNMIIPFPPFNEQVKIVVHLKKSLGLLKDLIQKKEQCFLVLKRSKESILSKAFQGALVPRKSNEGTGQELLENILESKKDFSKESDEKAPNKSVKKTNMKKAKK